LVVRPRRGYLAWAVDQLFRSEQHPMSVGQRVELTGMTAEVTALTNDGRPAEATFTFGVPLEDPSLRWMQWHEGRFVPFPLPAIGETVELRPRIMALWACDRRVAFVNPPGYTASRAKLRAESFRPAFFEGWPVVIVDAALSVGVWLMTG
jgi:hypothetical protein